MGSFPFRCDKIDVLFLCDMSYKDRPVTSSVIWIDTILAKPLARLEYMEKNNTEECLSILPSRSTEVKTT